MNIISQIETVNKVLRSDQGYRLNLPPTLFIPRSLHEKTLMTRSKTNVNLNFKLESKTDGNIAVFI